MDETRKPARKPRAAAAAKPVAKPAARPVTEPVSKKAAAGGKAVVAKKTAKAVPSPARSSAVEREQMVRIAAYFRAQRRGFRPGHEWEDWLEAEAELSATTDAAPDPQSRKATVRKAREG